MPASFDRLGPMPPDHPVVVSVPHAGRDYPLALRAMTAAPMARLATLEDRHVDAVAAAARTTQTMLVQRRARAWIDLNRAEDERDPLVEDHAPPGPAGGGTARLRGGLGLVPRRAAPGVDLWRRRLTGEEVAARIAADHRPYHHALAEALTAARARFGVAILLDLHSMPVLATARVVVGDRFGRSTAARFTERLLVEAAAAGLRTALNAPYAGGHVLDRHGRPDESIHAVQLELDRSLYLDAALNQPGPGLAATAALLRRMIDALADEALSGGQALAAQ